MRKQLRKKLRVGEFRQFAAHYRVRLLPGMDLASFYEQFWAGVVAPKSLREGGAAHNQEFVGVLMLGKREDCLPNRRAAEAWLSEHPAVESFWFGELFDFWNADWRPPPLNSRAKLVMGEFQRESLPAPGAVRWAAGRERDVAAAELGVLDVARPRSRLRGNQHRDVLGRAPDAAHCA